MRQLDSINNSVGTNVSKLEEIVEDRVAWCAAVHGNAELDMTSKLNNSNTEVKLQ